MATRLFFALLLLAVPSHAEWRRQSYTAKGGGPDIAAPHPQLYFTQDPFLRDDTNDFCTACTNEEKATLHLTRKARTDVRLVGTVARMRVFDVFSYFDEEEKPRWKFVLVQTGPDQYREIIHVQRTTAEQVVGPTTIVKAGTESIINCRAWLGVKSMTYGDYFWLGAQFWWT